MASPASSTVTFLYTNIEGSTRLWERQPEAMRKENQATINPIE